MYPIETYNYWLSLGTIGLQIATIALLAALVLRKRFPDLNDVVSFAGRNGLWIAFLLSLAGIALTLFYSEVLGIVPCGWCWVQRIFLYSQAVIFAVALFKRDRTIADYSIALSVFGAVAALYQHYLQMGGNPAIPCPASGAGDCAQRFLFEFGYITSPLMAFSLFAFFI